MNNPKLNPPIFIVGCGRSGTTLLLRISGKHKNIYAIEEESHLFVNYKTIVFLYYELFEKNKDFENLTLSILTTMFFNVDASAIITRSRKFPQEVVQLFNEIKQQNDFNNLTNKYEIFNLCSRYLTIKEGKERWVEKTPNNIHSIPYILSLYPDAKIVEIYRDPRAVSYSWLNAKQDFFRTSNLIQCIQTWRQAIGRGEVLANKIPDKYYQIKYENLINSPEQELKKLCYFLHEDFDPQMLDTKVVNSFFEDSEHQIGFSKAPVERWKKLLSRNELIFIDLLTKKYRKKLGYEDSGAKLTLFNFFPFIAFVIRKCMQGRRQLYFYFRFHLKRFTNIFNKCFFKT